MFVDDVHLLDTESVVLLRRLMDAGVVFLIGTVSTGAALCEALTALRSGASVSQVDLRELSEAQVGILVQQVLGGPVTRSTLHRLYAASGGNALYLRELVSGALEAGSLERAGELWELAERPLIGTPLLAELVESRLAAARDDGRKVLEVLALCERVALADARVIASADLLDELETHELIKVVKDLHRTYVTLADPLFGEVIRSRVPLLRSRTLFLQQVERVTAHGMRRREDALHIATWLLTATSTAKPELLEHAAYVARHTQDHGRVITLMRAVPEAQRTVEGCLLLGEGHFASGEMDAAEVVLRAAAERATSEQQRLAVTFTRTYNLFWGERGAPAALALNHAAHECVTTHAGRHALHLNEGALRVANGEVVRGLALLRDLRPETGQEPEDGSAQLNFWLQGLLLKSVGMAMTGRTDGAKVLAEFARSHLRRYGSSLAHHPALHPTVLTYVLAEAGEFAASRRTGECAHDALLTGASPLSRMWVAQDLGRTEWLAGHVASARSWYAEAAALARRHGIRSLRRTLSGLAAAAAVMGDLEAAEAALREAEEAPSFGVAHAEDRLGEAWVLATKGRLTQACAVLSESARRARELGHLASEGLLLTDMARLDRGAEVAGRLEDIAASCDGGLAAARARFAAGLAARVPERLLECADELEGMGADLLAAEAAAAAAPAWQRGGLARNANAAERRARTVAERCACLSSPTLAFPRPRNPLTPREREIAMLAAGGLSSKDIAGQLSLSARTVDNHLYRVYSKLGLSTRQELASLLGEGAARKERRG
ncbi:LuxR C-terminal-related transcriptional regulator [Streptomyces sp. Lzd4kr]|nr:LuxR C-terminal-related transcriptional regulator [Streptomyces sp. Lzd4kr]